MIILFRLSFLPRLVANGAYQTFILWDSILSDGFMLILLSILRDIVEQEQDRQHVEYEYNINTNILIVMYLFILLRIDDFEK